jgi:hypothetical protein
MYPRLHGCLAFKGIHAYIQALDWKDTESDANNSKAAMNSAAASMAAGIGVIGLIGASAQCHLKS